MIKFIDTLDARRVQDHSQTILDETFKTTYRNDAANIAVGLLLTHPKTDPFIRGLIGGAQSILYGQHIFSSEDLTERITLISFIGSTILGIYSPKLGNAVTIIATLALAQFTDKYEDAPIGSFPKDMGTLAALTVSIIDNRYLNIAYLASRILYGI